MAESNLDGFRLVCRTFLRNPRRYQVTGLAKILLYSLSDLSLATAFFHFLCDKSFEFAIQTWQTSLEQ